MKNPLICLLTAASLSSTLLAQAPYTVTPRGVDLIELSSATSIALNWTNSATRVQQADVAHLHNVAALQHLVHSPCGVLQPLQLVPSL